MHLTVQYNFVYTTLPIAGCYGLHFALLHKVFNVGALLHWFSQDSPTTLFRAQLHYKL